MTGSDLDGRSPKYRVEKHDGSSREHRIIGMSVRTYATVSAIAFVVACIIAIAGAKGWLG